MPFPATSGLSSTQPITTFGILWRIIKSLQGGARTLQLFIDENLWDEARVFKGKTTFKSGVKAPKFNGQCIETSHILEDMFSIYKNENN